jgi:hypothetical protein
MEMAEWNADCNGDGAVDYGQILIGTLEDQDGDGIPDCCQSGSDCPQQWRVEDGGNGHWYQLIENPSPTCWQDARTNAELLGGELASLETLLEFEFAKALAYSGKGPYGAHVGLIQEEGAEEPAGGWKWLSGMPLQYDEWASTLDDAGGCQDTAAFSDGSGFGKLDDIYPCGGCEFQSFLPYTLVEWNADCNGDGAVDYGQILTGGLQDLDMNGVPDVCKVCIGDLNGDGNVNAADIGLLIAAWNTDGSVVGGSDINNDGIVDAADLGLLVGSWGACSP